MGMASTIPTSSYIIYIYIFKMLFNPTTYKCQGNPLKFEDSSGQCSKPFVPFYWLINMIFHSGL